MNILITGGAGYLGSALCGALLTRAHYVTVLDCGRRGFKGLAPWIHNERFEFIETDLTKEFVCPDASVIVHLAGVVGADACQAEPEFASAVNFEAAQILSTLPSRFILASTASVYGISTGVATETSPVNPISLYAQTKLDAEKVTRDSGGTVLRFATLCGASPNTRLDLMVNEWAVAARTGYPLEVYGPDAFRPHLHVWDAAEAICAAVEKDCPGIYNVIGENLTKRDLAEKISDNIHFVDRGDPRDYQVSGFLFNETFNWLPRRRVTDAVREIQAIYR